MIVAAIVMGLSYAFSLLIGFEAPQVKKYALLNMFDVAGDALYTPTSLHLLLPILVGIAILLQIWGIFAFGNLKRQSKIVVSSLAMILLYYVQLGYEYLNMSQQLAGTIVPNLGAVLPAVAFIFSVMAWRSIQRDYKLIRSIDRIR